LVPALIKKEERERERKEKKRKRRKKGRKKEREGVGVWWTRGAKQNKQEAGNCRLFTGPCREG
jgi:hypothetical protein